MELQNVSSLYWYAKNLEFVTKLLSAQDVYHHFCSPTEVHGHCAL